MAGRNSRCDGAGVAGKPEPEHARTVASQIRTDRKARCIGRPRKSRVSSRCNRTAPDLVDEDNRASNRGESENDTTGQPESHGVFVQGRTPDQFPCNARIVLHRRRSQEVITAPLCIVGAPVVAEPPRPTPPPVHHRIRHLQEPRDIRPVHEVSRRAVLLGGLEAVLVDRAHDLVETSRRFDPRADQFSPPPSTVSASYSRCVASFARSRVE